jgi:hypothetical protein
MFSDMFHSMEAGTAPMETFYDGYVVNAIMDACYKSAESNGWAKVELDWRGGSTPRISSKPQTFEGKTIIKQETLPDGRVKLILKDPKTQEFTDRIVATVNA